MDCAAAGDPHTANETSTAPIVNFLCVLIGPAPAASALAARFASGVSLWLLRDSQPPATKRGGSPDAKEPDLSQRSAA